MKQLFLQFILILFVLAGNLSVGAEPDDVSTEKTKLPTNAAELIAFLPGTTWRLQSSSGAYYGEGTLLFKDNGVVIQIYKDGVPARKKWAVTSDMRVIWGGKFLRILRLSNDFKSFVDNHMNAREG